MGVLYDYFRASDSATVAQACASTGCRSPLTAGQFPGLDLKGIDDAVTLGKLVALIRGVDWDPHLVDSAAVCPPAQTMPTESAAWAALGEDSQWLTGPWVNELAMDVRDTIGTVADEEIPELGAAWSRIEEFNGSVDADDCAEGVRMIVDLARDAMRHDEMLYVWICL